MFRKLFAVIVISGIFLGGYYVGRRPGSPDIFAWAQRTYQQVSEMGSQIAGETQSASATVGQDG